MTTLMDGIDSFILDQRLKGNTDKTIKGYHRFLSLFATWLFSQKINNISDITLQHVREYHLYLINKPAERRGGIRLKKRSIQTYIRHIKVFLSFCHAEELLSEPLHLKVKTPKAERPTIEIITDEEYSRIMDTFSDNEIGRRNRAITSLLLDCGLRLSEVIKLETDNINFTKQYIKVMGKGQKERIIPFGSNVRRLLLYYVHERRAAKTPNDDKYFFLSIRRKAITSSCIGTLMRRLKKRTGITRLHAHLFRHTFATNFLVHGLGDIYQLSLILGHCEVKVTELYLQLASYYTLLEKRKHVTYLDILEQQ